MLTPHSLSHYLPESPRYDVIRGREDLARKTMRLVYTNISEEIVELKLDSIRETVNLSKAFQERWPISKRPFIMFKTGAYRRPLIAACGIMAFQQLSGFNSLLCKLLLLSSVGGYRASKQARRSPFSPSLRRLLGYHLPGCRIQQRFCCRTHRRRHQLRLHLRFDGNSRPSRQAAHYAHHLSRHDSRPRTCGRSIPFYD